MVAILQTWKNWQVHFFQLTRDYEVHQNIPFLLDAETLLKGLNFAFITNIGNLDLLGEVRGVGHYNDVVDGSVTYELFGYRFAVIDIGKLIIAKRAAGRPKDLIVIPELEAIQERQRLEESDRD